MQTIETRTIPATNTKPMRIIAQNCGGTRLMWSWDFAQAQEGNSGRDNKVHASIAKALAAKLGWEGNMYGGHTKAGMVWVFEDSNNLIAIAGQVQA